MNIIAEKRNCTWAIATECKLQLNQDCDLLEQRF